MLATLNGVQLYFEGHGSGDPLIFLHGFSGCSQSWLPLIAEWCMPFQLILPDLRGQRPLEQSVENIRHNEAAADMLALVDHLGIRTFKGLEVSGHGAGERDQLFPSSGPDHHAPVSR